MTKETIFENMLRDIRLFQTSDAWAGNNEKRRFRALQHLAGNFMYKNITFKITQQPSGGQGMGAYAPCVVVEILSDFSQQTHPEYFL